MFEGELSREELRERRKARLAVVQMHERRDTLNMREAMAELALPASWMLEQERGMWS